MKAGDLVKLISWVGLPSPELALVLSMEKQPDSDTFWLECLWAGGEVEGIESDEMEVVGESR